jgi:hypothetical protein
MTRPCAWCSKPLPAESWHRRLYHDECKIFVHRLTNRESDKRVSIRKQAHARPRNPMKLLGLDYVTLKLKGSIHIPIDSLY